MPKRAPSFNFTLPNGNEGTAEEWLDRWCKRYRPVYDEPAYHYLVRKASQMTEQDLQILGAWKDGALKRGPDLLTEMEFDPSKVSFNGRWSPNSASVAFQIWTEAGKELGGRMTTDFAPDAAEFLRFWSERVGSSGARTKRFGVSRATTLLHFVSGGRYPIFDSRVRRAVKRLTGITPTNSVDWYLNEFCQLFAELKKVCAAVEPRKVDKALFAYGAKK